LWLKSEYSTKPGEGVGIADTAFGCIYCGQKKPLDVWLEKDDINWEMTEHRSQEGFSTKELRRAS